MFLLVENKGEFWHWLGTMLCISLFVTKILVWSGCTFLVIALVRFPLDFFFIVIMLLEKDYYPEELIWGDLS